MSTCFLMLLAIGCETEQQVDISDQCVQLDGNWVPETTECEYISEQDCTDLGGTFNQCASACRNDPDAAVCTMQCVPVCDL